MKDKNNKDILSNFWFILSNMLPPIGFFLYFKHRNQFQKKAKKALVGALIGIPVGMMMSYLFNNYMSMFKFYSNIL